MVDTCTARDEYFAPEEKQNDQSIGEETSIAGGILQEKEEEEAIVLHRDGEEHSAPSSSVSNPAPPPQRGHRVQRKPEEDAGLVDSIDRLFRVIETILIKMDCINNRLDLLETHVDAANDVRFWGAPRQGARNFLEWATQRKRRQQWRCQSSKKYIRWFVYANVVVKEYKFTLGFVFQHFISTLV